MGNLRFAFEIEEIAKAFSLREKVAADVRAADGSHRVFAEGSEIENVGAHWGSAMPVMTPGQPASYLDMTPREVSLGQWLEEVQQFVSSRGPMSISDFLKLSGNSNAAGSHS